MIEVTIEKYNEFLKSYPGHLSRCVHRICEPNIITYDNQKGETISKVITSEPPKFFIIETQA